MALNITIEPSCARWTDRLERDSGDSVFGHSLAEWFAKTRRELGLDAAKPIVATGHQTLLWHPGILIKYLAVDAFAAAHACATANLIVDQHADGFGDFDVPLERADGSLIVRRLHLTTPRRGVPMGLHEPFTPPKPIGLGTGALPSVAHGVKLIYDRVYDHRDAASAARQMACALEDLTTPWVKPMPGVTASDLLGTTFAKALLAKMADDPEECVKAYNEAVQAMPEAGIGTLLIRDDYVELPLWRIRDDGRRMHAYDNDVQAWIETPGEAPALMPRALLLTALVRLGMCDLFVHGMGGANYDRAMERWVENWLGVKPSAIAMATATLRLPLMDERDGGPDLQLARQARRRAWHDPESSPETPGRPGTTKATLLARIEQAPYGTSQRRKAFFDLHEHLRVLREEHVEKILRTERDLQGATLRTMNLQVADRRDWAFPLYPRDMLDELAAEVRNRIADAAPCPG